MCTHRTTAVQPLGGPVVPAYQDKPEQPLDHRRVPHPRPEWNHPIRSTWGGATADTTAHELPQVFAKSLAVEPLGTPVVPVVLQLPEEPGSNHEEPRPTPERNHPFCGGWAGA